MLVGSSHSRHLLLLSRISHTLDVMQCMLFGKFGGNLRRVVRKPGMYRAVHKGVSYHIGRNARIPSVHHGVFSKSSQFSARRDATFYDLSRAIALQSTLQTATVFVKLQPSSLICRFGSVSGHQKLQRSVWALISCAKQKRNFRTNWRMR